MVDADVVRSKFELIGPHLDERTTRLWAAVEARALGYGGIEAVARATGVAASRIRRGQGDLAGGEVLEAGRVRRAWKVVSRARFLVLEESAPVG